METVYIQIRAPRGSDPGRVLEGHYNIVGDTVVLVDPSGKALTSDDQKYSRKLAPGDHPKQIAAQLLRAHHNAVRGGTPARIRRPNSISKAEILILRRLS